MNLRLCLKFKAQLKDITSLESWNKLIRESANTLGVTKLIIQFIVKINFLYFFVPAASSKQKAVSIHHSTQERENKMYINTYIWNIKGFCLKCWDSCIPSSSYCQSTQSPHNPRTHCVKYWFLWMVMIKYILKMFLGSWNQNYA